MTKKRGDYMKPETLMRSIWARITKTDSCWLWTGRMMPTSMGGYGRVTRPQGSKGEVRGTTAHRLVYELLVGEVPEGMHLHHTCENPRCVRPDHMQVVTPREHAEISNARRRLLRLVATYEQVMSRYAGRLEGAVVG